MNHDESATVFFAVLHPKEAQSNYQTHVKTNQKRDKNKPKTVKTKTCRQFAGLSKAAATGSAQERAKAEARRERARSGDDPKSLVCLLFVVAFVKS